MAMKDVRIIVKNVYAHDETQQFVLSPKLTVRALKDMLQSSLPGNPEPKHQKLIFGGKICKDESSLEKVLSVQARDSEDAVEADVGFVFHLMVTSALPKSRPPTPTGETAAAASSPAAVDESASSTPPPMAPVMQTPPTAQDEGRHASSAPAPGAPSDPAAFPRMAPYPTEAHTQPPPHHHTQQQHHHHLFTQAVMMQQQAMILAQIQHLQHLQAHYAAHHQAAATTNHGAHHAQAHAPHPGYHPHMQGAFGMHHMHGAHNPYLHVQHGRPFHPAGVHGPGAAPHGVTPHVFPAPPPVAHMHPAAPFPAPAGAPGHFQPAFGVAPRPVAPPRPVGPFGQAMREIAPLLDLRLAMKMSFMLFIIGQDTPQDRLIVLALMSFGAYLHITGILAKVYEILQRANGSNANDEVPQARDADNANAEPNPNAVGLRGSAVLTRLLRISPDRGFVQDVRYFVSGLLLSLVPAWHPQALNGDTPDAGLRPEPMAPDAVGEIPVQGI